MAEFLSGRQRNIKVGVSSFNDTTTVLEVTGRIGIGTTNATSELDIQGNQRVSGVVTASQFVGQVNAGVATITTLSGSTASYNTLNSNVGVITSLRGSDLNYSGIGTITRIFGTEASFAGVVTALNFQGNLIGNADTATYAANAGIATNADYADVAGIATYASYAPNAGIATNANAAQTSLFANYRKLRL